MKAHLCTGLIGSCLLLTPIVASASTPTNVKLTLKQYKALKYCSPLISPLCNRLWVRNANGKN